MDSINALLELLKSDMVKDNMLAIIILLIIVAILSSGITILIMDKLIFQSRLIESNNEIQSLKEEKDKSDELRLRNEELNKQNENLRNEISKYKFIKSAIDQNYDFDSKALDAFVKKNKRNKKPEKEEP